MIGVAIPEEGLFRAEGPPFAPIILLCHWYRKPDGAAATVFGEGLLDWNAVGQPPCFAWRS